MNKSSALRASLLLSGVLGALPGLAAPSAGPEVSPVEWLLSQVRTGESTSKYDLVQQALYRLEKIDPDNPQVLAARLRLALHQGDIAAAQTLLTQLKKVAPDSAATRESAVGLALISSEGRQKLQEARLLATSGRLAEAKSAYDALFNGVFPDANIALEYWRLLARIPGQDGVAYQQLQALEQRYPGNIGVELQLARMAFDRQQPAQAVEQLK
ncbi:MAG TPA: cellulose biosynthesis protein BcsC, partial [Pantoea sp.]|nr:cellulose biosynthesis protein BcsC [Pantoea sp.]